jgi:hypothetical protein
MDSVPQEAHAIAIDQERRDKWNEDIHEQQDRANEKAIPPALELKWETEGLSQIGRRK